MTGLRGEFVWTMTYDVFAQAPLQPTHFWLATQLDPQNDWTAWRIRVNYDVFAQAPLQPTHFHVLWRRKVLWVGFKSSCLALFSFHILGKLSEIRFKHTKSPTWGPCFENGHNKRVWARQSQIGSFQARFSANMNTVWLTPWSKKDHLIWNLLVMRTCAEQALPAPPPPPIFF